MQKFINEINQSTSYDQLVEILDAYQVKKNNNTFSPIRHNFFLMPPLNAILADQLHASQNDEGDFVVNNNIVSLSEIKQAIITQTHQHRIDVQI